MPIPCVCLVPSQPRTLPVRGVLTCSGLAAINNAANQAGVPQQDDKMIDDVADKKINDKLPGGN